MKKFLLDNHFINGYGRALDLFGVLGRWPKLADPRQHDRDAIIGDWERVKEGYLYAAETTARQLAIG